MPRAKRVCPSPGCPAIIPAGQARCAECARKYEAQRGSKAERGYGVEHQRTRQQWKRELDNHPWPCARCGTLIFPGQPWHLDHTDDRTAYLGPSCITCNTSAGGQARHRQSP